MNIEIGDDFAQVKNTNLQFYYGYEEELDGEWCFTVKKREREIYRLKMHELDSDFTNPPEHYLILGMLRFISLKMI